MITKELEQETLRLNPLDKIKLVEILLQSLDRPDPDIEKAWIEESDRRYAAYLNGQIKGSSLDNIKNRFRKCK